MITKRYRLGPRTQGNVYFINKLQCKAKVGRSSMGGTSFMGNHFGILILEDQVL